MCERSPQPKTLRQKYVRDYYSGKYPDKDVQEISIVEDTMTKTS